MDESYFGTFIDALAKCKDRMGVLGSEYLVYPPREHSDYAATPRNVVTFGTMGVDGVHYVILKIDGQVEDSSPVIEISPTDREPYNLLADSLLEYFSIACSVTRTEMQNVFDEERGGSPVLIAFLKKHFKHSRCKGRSIAPYRDRLEVEDEPR